MLWSLPTSSWPFALLALAVLMPGTVRGQDSRRTMMLHTVQQLNDDELALPAHAVRDRLVTRTSHLRARLRRVAAQTASQGGVLVVEFTLRGMQGTISDVDVVTNTFSLPRIDEEVVAHLEDVRWAAGSAVGTGRYRVVYSNLPGLTARAGRAPPPDADPVNCVGMDLHLVRLTREGHCLSPRRAPILARDDHIANPGNLVVEVPQQLTVTAGDIVRVPIVLTNRSNEAALLMWSDELFVASDAWVSRVGERGDVRGCETEADPQPTDHHVAEVAGRGRATWTLPVSTRLCRPGMTRLGGQTMPPGVYILTIRVDRLRVALPTATLRVELVVRARVSTP